MSQIFDWNCLKLKKIEQLSTALHDFWSCGKGFRRRVDSLHLIDAFLFEQRITLDWNLCAINSLLKYCGGEAAFIPVYRKSLLLETLCLQINWSPPQR